MKFARWPAALCCLVVSAAAALALGGIKDLSAEDEGAFSAGYYSVILAKFRHPSEYPEGTPTFTDHATLEPLSTLTGTFDCGLHPTIEVDFSAGNAVLHSIGNVPPDGSTVLAVIWPDVPIGLEMVKRNVILSRRCLFMPGEAGLVQVRGPDDSKVWETLKRIQEARLKPEPAARPSTRPAR